MVNLTPSTRAFTQTTPSGTCRPPKLSRIRIRTSLGGGIPRAGFLAILARLPRARVDPPKLIGIRIRTSSEGGIPRAGFLAILARPPGQKETNGGAFSLHIYLILPLWASRRPSQKQFKGANCGVACLKTPRHLYQIAQKCTNAVVRSQGVGPCQKKYTGCHLLPTIIQSNSMS